MRLSVVAGVSVTLLIAVAGSSSAQSAGGRSLSFDVFAFSQRDDAGQPLKAEGFVYGGVRIDAELPLSGAIAWRVNASVALVSNDDPESLPPTVGNANVTSASADILTLDTSVGLVVRRSGSPWTWLPGLFYHHQDGYIVGGADLAVRRELHAGDATIAVDYSFRYAYPRLQYWDFSVRGRDSVYSNNLLLGWTQTLSPSWVTNLSLQLTRQDGFLSEPFNYVVLYTDDIPVRLADEVLPRSRNRAQLNARVRHSPSVGVGFGVDASAYADDWGVRHLAAEPSVAVPLSAQARARVWYRIVAQEGARYSRLRPRELHTFQTQDSDLSTFQTHGGGTTVSLPIGDDSESRWRYRLSVFGFYRDDEVYAAGVDAGLRVEW